MIQNFYEDFKTFIKLLNKFGVEYLIVGGYALAIHSRPRSTQDIDIWVKPSKGNAEKALKAIDEFGFGSLNVLLNDLLDKKKVIQLGVAPIRIDIMSSIDGVTFDEAFQNRLIYKFDDIENVTYISFDDLITNKNSSGRDKDITDINWLKKYGKNRKNI